MTDRNLPVRITLILVAIIALLAVLTQFSSHDEDATATDMRALPVVATKVERPTKPPQSEGDPLLTPPRRAARFSTAIAISGDIDALDSTTFRTTQAFIRLGHLAGPASDAVCLGEDGAPWDCGLQARVALLNVLRSGRVKCLPALDTPGERDSFQCWVGEEDLSRVMIRRGWAKPAPLHISPYAAELDAAIVAKAGVWRGKWPAGDALPIPSIESRREIAGR